jgi:hypothetical protein
VFGRTVSQTVVPFTFIVYLVISAPPSKVDEPHETVNLETPSTAAAKRVGAPGATLGVCIADAVFALDSVEAWSVTVTTLNSSAVGSVLAGVLLGVGVLAAADCTGAAEYEPTEGDELIVAARIEAMRTIGVPTVE